MEPPAAPSGLEPTLARVEQLLHAARTARFVVLGDVMLDVTLAGSVERICPEAPVPVLSVGREEFALGGAANVANNLAPFASGVALLGVVGDDADGRRLAALAIEAGIRHHLAAEEGRTTTSKTRMVSFNQQLLRCDRESKEDLRPETARRLLAALEAAVDDGTIVLAPDYAKGCLPRGFFAEVAALCRKREARLLVDPKRSDLTHYRGASLLKPNRRESEVSAGFPLHTPADALRAARVFLEQTGADAVLITLGAQGMVVCERDGGDIAIPTEPREVFDVTGAGDTSLAFLALGLAGGWTIPQAAALANLAAGIKIEKRGTARVEPFELLSALALRERRHGLDHKIVARAGLARLGETLRKRDRRIVFTNGCFDLFHPGHADLLRRARALGGVLVVGLNSDASVARLKGAGRPYVDEAGRLSMLCALECVDHVVVFDEDTPHALLEELRPDVLAKGANYSVEQVAGGDLVRAQGGEVRVLPLVEGHSVTDLSHEIHRRLSKEGQPAVR